MFAAILDARRAKGCCRHDWMLGARRDVVGMTERSALDEFCFLEELTRDHVPRAVMNGVNCVLLKFSRQQQVPVGELSKRT